MTPKNKMYIDSLSYEELLRQWRFAPVGNLWFQGETGEYWSKRMGDLRGEAGGNDRHVKASKAIGW